jgi:hypothetical protein
MLIINLAMKKKTNSKKEITNDDLALMVARGFEDAGAELSALKLEMREEFKRVNAIMGVMDDRLIKIESHYGRRLDNLEDKSRIFANVFEKNLKIKLSKGF